jgi:hypothetical protein
MQPMDSPGLLRQFARWIGRGLGLVQPETDPRVAWREEAEGGVHPVAVNLPVAPPRAGRYLLTLRVTELATGQATETQRPLLVR